MQKLINLCYRLRFIFLKVWKIWYWSGKGGERTKSQTGERKGKIKKNSGLSFHLIHLTNFESSEAKITNFKPRRLNLSILHNSSTKKMYFCLYFFSRKLSTNSLQISNLLFNFFKSVSNICVFLEL